MKPLLDADTLLAHSTVVNTTGVVYLGTTPGRTWYAFSQNW